MNILITIPPSEFLIDDRAFPFLGPLQIATVGMRAGHNVEVCDLTGHSRRCQNHTHDGCVLEDAKDVLAAHLRRFDPDLVGFYSLYAQFPIVSRLRHVADGVATVIGGPHASTATSECKEHGFDYVVVSDQGGGGGEPGFLKVLDLVTSAKRGHLRLVDDGIVREPSRPAGFGQDRGEYLNDRWPYPARHLIDLGSYRYEVGGRRTTTVVSQAGCPYSCDFCGHLPAGGYTKMVLRSPSHTVGEIEQILFDYPWVGSIMFYDDEVNMRRDFMHFLHAIGEAGNYGDRLLYRGFFKCGKNLVRRDIFQAMKLAGFHTLCTGAESANPNRLARMGKGASIEDNTNFIALCAEVGINVKLFTMVAHPGETWESVRELRDWLVRMVDIANGRISVDADVTILTPTRNTPIWDHPERYPDLIFDRETLDFGKDLIHYKGKPGEYKAIVRTPAMTSDELVQARQWVEDEFRKTAGLAPLAAKDDG